MFGLILLARSILLAQTAVVPAKAPDTTHADKVIVKLVCRSQTVTVVSTLDGVRYSANDLTGKTLFSAVTLEKLKSDHPDVYRLIIPTICATDGRQIMADVDIHADDASAAW